MASASVSAAMIVKAGARIRLRAAWVRSFQTSRIVSSNVQGLWALAQARTRPASMDARRCRPYNNFREPVRLPKKPRRLSFGMERPNAGRRWSSGARRKTRLRGFGPVDQGGMRVISKRRGLTRGEDRRLFPRGAACHPELTRVIALMDDEDAEEAGPCGLLTERFR